MDLLVLEGDKLRYFDEYLCEHPGASSLETDDEDGIDATNANCLRKDSAAEY